MRQQMSRAQQSKQYNDLITSDTYSEEAEVSMTYCIIDKLLKKKQLVKRGGSAMTNQQLSDAFRLEPAYLLSDGDKIISYEEGLKLARKGRYYHKIPVKFNMQTAAKVGVQREYYDWCTMDAVIAHIPEIDIQRTQDKNGKWGFTASLLPDAERKAIYVMKVCQAVKELPDVPVNFKMDLCKFHFSKHGCVNGGRCHFAHSEKELRKPPPPSLIQAPPQKPAKPAPRAPPTPAPWFRQDESDASPIQPPLQEPAPLVPPAPPALWFR
jgi:hypothetical protein